MLGLSHERQGVANPAGATSATNPVDVIIVGVWLRVVDDVGDVGDVEAAGGNIGGDEDFDSVFFEALEGAGALRLAFAAVDTGHIEAASRQVIFQPFHAALGGLEHDSLDCVGLNEDVVEFFLLVGFAIEPDDVLVDILAGVTGGQGHELGIGRERADEVTDPRVHGGGKVKRLAPG